MLTTVQYVNVAYVKWIITVLGTMPVSSLLRNSINFISLEFSFRFFRVNNCVGENNQKYFVLFTVSVIKTENCRITATHSLVYAQFNSFILQWYRRTQCFWQLINLHNASKMNGNNARSFRHRQQWFFYCSSHLKHCCLLCSHSLCLAHKWMRYGMMKRYVNASICILRIEIQSIDRFHFANRVSNNWKKKRQAGHENLVGKVFRQYLVDSRWHGFHHSRNRPLNRKSIEIFIQCELRCFLNSSNSWKKKNPIPLYSHLMHAIKYKINRLKIITQMIRIFIFKDSHRMKIRWKTSFSIQWPFIFDSTLSVT